MGPAVGTIARILVHEALAILASDLCDLLVRHRTVWRHPVSWHRLTVSWTCRDPVSWVGIVSWVVSGWAIALRYRITGRHVALHWLGDTAWWDKRSLCLAGEVRAAFDLDNSLGAVL